MVVFVHKGEGGGWVWRAKKSDINGFYVVVAPYKSGLLICFQKHMHFTQFKC